MEDSFKGLIVTLVIIGLFITSILSYIVIFPQEQGISFTDLQSNDAYLTINSSRDVGTNTFLNTNSLNNSYNDWDITQGFMGSNALKQGTPSEVGTYNANIFSTLTLMVNKLFGSGTPIAYAILIISGLSGIIIIILAIQWLRQGR